MTLVKTKVVEHAPKDLQAIITRIFFVPQLFKNLQFYRLTRGPIHNMNGYQDKSYVQKLASSLSIKIIEGILSLIVLPIHFIALFYIGV